MAIQYITKTKKYITKRNNSRKTINTGTITYTKIKDMFVPICSKA